MVRPLVVLVNKVRVTKSDVARRTIYRLCDLCVQMLWKLHYHVNPWHGIVYSDKLYYRYNKLSTVANVVMRIGRKLRIFNKVFL